MFVPCWLTWQHPFMHKPAAPALGLQLSFSLTLQQWRRKTLSTAVLVLAVWHSPVSFCLNGNQVPNYPAWELLLPCQKCFLFAESIFSLTGWVCAKASPWNSLGIRSGATPCPKPAGLSPLSTRYKQVKRRLHRRWKDESGHLLKMMQNLWNFYQQQALRGFCKSCWFLWFPF